MKKVLLTAIILICISSLQAVSWNPSFDITVFYDGTDYSDSIDSSAMLRSSIGGSFRAEIATLSIGKHRIALPFAVSVLSVSNATGRTMIQSRAASKLSVEYGYSFSRIFTLSASIDTIYEYYLKAEGGRWLAGSTITPEINAGSVFSVIMPLSLYFGKGSFSFTSGAGVRIRI